MKNLAGETRADLLILKELDEAGIEIVEGSKSSEEVPCTLTGKLGDWNFSRAWYYWVASASEGGGLPLDVATELHERKYPVSGEREPETCGGVVRVAGHCGCPPPSEWVKHYDAQGLQLIVDPGGKREADLELMIKHHPDLQKHSEGYRFVPDLVGVVAKSVVDSYHVDSQEGLNALANSIRNLHKIVLSGTNPEEIRRLHEKISTKYVQWEIYEQQDGVEWFKKLPTLPISCGERIVTELIVAIEHRNEVVSIAKKWKSPNSRGIVQHHFEDEQITGFNYGNISGPGQILNRGPEIDEKLRLYYEELKSIRPKATFSLELCMQRLETPGPEYTGKSDGSVSIKLAGR